MTDPSESARPTPRVAYVPSRPSAMPDDAAAAACDPANVVGKYVRVTRIGSGGMGEVWRAWDRELRRWTALKFLKTAEGEERERFLREAQTAARLSHPNICPIYEVGRHGERDYIAMQLVQGKTLAGVPRDDRRRVVSLVRDAASALQHAHDRGVVHRDVKPQNIMVEADRVFVMDFGLAKETSVQSSLSLSGYLIGTPTYMSPEQARGRPALIGPHSDVYSLGATLYEMLTGRPPFVEKDIYELVRLHTEVDPPAPRSIDPTIDRDLETVVLRALEKSPSRRYATARELAEELDRWLAGEPVQARPPSLAYRLSKFAARRRGVLVASFAAVAVTVAFAAWAATTMLERRRAEHARAERDRITVEALSSIERARRAIEESTAALYTAEGPSDADFRRLTQARELLERVTAEAPWLPLGHHLLGRAWQLEGWDDRAMQAWARAVAVDERFAPPHLELARARMRLSFMGAADGERWTPPDPESAGRILESAERARRVDAWFEDPMDRAATRFMVEMLSGRHDQARAIALEAIERGAGRRGSEELHVLLAILPGEDPDRFARLDRALAIRPWYPLALQIRAVLKHQLGQVREAVGDLDRSLRVSPREADVWLMRGRLRADLGDRGAADDCDRAIELGAVARGWYVRGIVRRTLGDADGAVEACTAAIRHGCAEWGVWNTRGCAHMDAGRWEAARADFEEVVRRAPHVADGHGNRAQILVKLERFDEALPAADEAVRLAPHRADAWSARGLVRARRGDTKGAAEDFTEAIRRSPGEPGYYVNRSTVRLVSGDENGARADLEAAAKLAPHAPVVQLALARLHLTAGRLREGIAALDAALRAEPSNVQARLLRAQARYDLGEFAEAERDCTEALRLAPGQPHAHLNRGTARDMQDDLDGAAADYGEAIRLDPSMPEPYANRGFLRKRRGDAAGARADLKKALEVAPAGWPRREDVVSALKELGE